MSYTERDREEDALPAPIDRDDFDTEEEYEGFMEDLAMRQTYDSMRGAL
jgi:hypothetical protein